MHEGVNAVKHECERKNGGEIMTERICENCVNGQGLAGFKVYCSKHHGEKRDKDVCPDHRFIREEFDPNSTAPFTDWIKKRKVVKMAHKVLGFSLPNALICTLGKGKMLQRK